MAHFCLLRDPDSYVAHDLDLLSDPALREYWLDLFCRHFETVLNHASTRYARQGPKRVGMARQAFQQLIAQLRSDPKSLPHGRLNVMELGRARDKILRDSGIDDPFALVKQQQNAAALPQYSDVVHRLHVLEDDVMWLRLIQCALAGNLFDVGSLGAVERTAAGQGFLAAVDMIQPRPWLVDHYDRLAEDLLQGPPAKWGKAAVFVDNAGFDFVLGVMPLVREMALRGTAIVLAANERPVLNDLTADETVALVERMAAADEDLAALIQAGMMEVVSTGGNEAMIDLSQVSDELNAAVSDADLVILEGMGRAVESNFNAGFRVDCLSLALLKDPQVAARLGGKEYDCVCKYVPVET